MADITVHSRSGYERQYSRLDADDNKIDISGSTIYFEVPAAHLRKAMIADVSDALGLLIQLTREEVETLPSRASEFRVVDETGTIPVVEWKGTIVRTGVIGDANG